MDKTIVAIRAVLVALGVGFLVAIQVMSYLHSAYITGGHMWIALGGITIVLGMKKQERLGKNERLQSSVVYQKNAMGA